MLRESHVESIRLVAKCLENGGVALLPTDTVYGLAAMPTFDEAVGRIFSLKGRPRDVNLPIMVASPHALQALGFDINEAARRLLDSPLVPGSLTLALGFLDAPAVSWLQGREEAAVRIPDDEWLLSLLREVGPLLVTSANCHGADTPESMEGVLFQLQDRPDIAVDGGFLRSIPSTLVNCRLNPPVVERVGAIPAFAVLEYLK